MIIEPNNCYNMDCAEGMRLMKEQGLKADWCITDPPYGIGIDGQKQSINKNPKYNKKLHKAKGWDKSIPPQKFLI